MLNWSETLPLRAPLDLEEDQKLRAADLLQRWIRTHSHVFLSLLSAWWRGTAAGAVFSVPLDGDGGERGLEELLQEVAGMPGKGC